MTILENKTLKKTIIAIAQLLFFVAVFLFLDLLFMYFVGGNRDGIKHIVTTDIAIGLVCSMLLSYTCGVAKKVIYVIVNMAVSLYAILIFIEIALKMSFDTFYTLETIVYNARSVITEYAGDVSTIIRSRSLMILLLILIVIFSFYTSKVLYFDEKIYMREGTSMKKVIKLTTCILIILLSFIIGVSSIRGDSHDFTDLLTNKGLKSAVYHEYTKDDDITFVMYEDKQETVATEVIETRETIETIGTTDTTDTAVETTTEIAAETIKPIRNVKPSIYDDVNNFVLSCTPTGRNAYTGLFKGKNLIMICAEAFNSVVVDKNLFPTLYRLINNGFKFNHFYQQKEGSTSSGEFVFMTGLLPIHNDRSFMQSINNNMGFTVSSMLHEAGYNTLSFHNGLSTFYNRDKTHGKHMGFDSFMANDTGLSDISGARYPGDYELFSYTYDLIPKDKPFLAYYMTYSGHMPYTGFKTSKRYKIADLYYGNTKSEPVKTYIAKSIMLEEGLTSLLNNLEASGLIDDTVICIVPDHYPYGLYNANAVTGEKINYVAELYNDPNIDSHPMLRDRTDLILWSGCLEKEHKDMVKEVNKICSTIDVTPTLLNLFDLPFDSRIYPGRDIFSDEEGIVIYNNGRYIANGDVNADGTINNESVVRHQAYVRNILNYCTFFIKNDYYGYLSGKKGSAN